MKAKGRGFPLDLHNAREARSCQFSRPLPSNSKSRLGRGSIRSSGSGAVPAGADVIVGGDFPDSEQGLAVRAPMAFLQSALEREKRGALHEKQRKRRKSEVRYRDVAAASLPGVRKACAHHAQSTKKGRQKLHPNGGITSPLIWESLKCARSPLLELLASA
jgi:hypothetical protein